jgi:phosphatidylinositol-3-phosphatase
VKRFAAAIVLVAAACTTSNAARSPGPTSSHAVAGAATTNPVPQFAHIVVVVEENRSYADVIGNPAAPYINRLAATGALLTRSYGVRHPSEPNYLALFSASAHGLTDDSCPHRYGTRNLGSQLRAHGLRFIGYAESLPYVGYLGCSAGAYARKHAPWTNFTNLPTAVGKPMRAFPTDYRRLPRVSFVIPNLDNDMHDGTIGTADTWLHVQLGDYVRWARTHNSLLVLTWDEDDWSANNRIPGVLAGDHVRQMRYDGRVDHYRMLRTLEAACGLPALGATRYRTPISATWTP